MPMQNSVGSHHSSFLDGMGSGGFVIGKLHAFVVHGHVVIEEVEIVERHLRAFRRKLPHFP